MTWGESSKSHRYFSEYTEIDRAKVAGLDRQRRMAGACGDDPAGFQGRAELAQFIGEPGQRQPGIAEHVLAMADELLAAHRGYGPLLDQIECAPVRGRGRTQHEQMRAGIVGDELRSTSTDEIGEPRIRNLDRRVQRVDGVEHLAHGVGCRSRRQIGAHAKRKFRLGDAHLVAGHRRRSAVGKHGLGQDASGHRTLDIDVFLAGFAGGRDLPAEQMRARISLDGCLDCIAFGAVRRTAPVVECVKLGAGAPMVVQRLRGRRDLVSVEHNPRVLK